LAGCCGEEGINEITERLRHLKGTPREAGLSLGLAMGERLDVNIHRYIDACLRSSSADIRQLEKGALPWFENLPVRYREEMEGISESSGIPLQRLAEWYYVSELTDIGCTGVIVSTGNQVWVARNNDMWAPELWSYACICEITGRIPTITFGMEGDIFTGTGINKERLWLHYNYLPVIDEPSGGRPHYPAWVWLTEALETCRNLSEVEILLTDVDRNAGMKLFGVDGKTNEYAVYDCSCSGHLLCNKSANWTAGTNHYYVNDFRSGDDDEYSRSVARLNRVNDLMRDIDTANPSNIYRELRKVLADYMVEARGDEYYTVYSNIACPVGGEILYTFGGYPAASSGNWQKLPWPWQ